MAFAEQRFDNCGDAGNHDIVLRRSRDEGRTWEDAITVVQGHGQPLSNANPVEVDMGDGKKSILLHYDTMNNPSPQSHGDLMQTWSHDDGLSWEMAVVITHFLPQDHQACMPGPSVGVQDKDKAIYFSCHPISPEHVVFIYLSRDLGKTWQAGDVLGGMDECSVALLSNQSLAMNCRLPQGGQRAQITWSNQGKVIAGPIYPAGLVDPGCQGSLIATADGALYLSNPDFPTRRWFLTVKRSTDFGQTWDTGILVWAQMSSYSQLVTWSAGGQDRMGVLFEQGNKEGIYEGIAFTNWNMVLEQNVAETEQPVIY